MVTVDRIAGRNQETLFRLIRTDTRECSAQAGNAARVR
jgi:4-hydroxymandelate oxidase